ncbi:MAG: DUF732 domain-containing protein [Mycobacterium sp.]|nr:DUF732 domain-containing protein [Mycobacterium sp.]
MRYRSFQIGALTATLATTAVLSTATAHADTNADFLRLLSNANIGYTNSADTTALGKSVCDMLVEPGKSFASAVTKVRNNGVSPQLASFFTGIAIQAYCPSMMSSIADGSVLNQLGNLDNLTGSSLLSGLNIPGL